MTRKLGNNRPAYFARRSAIYTLVGSELRPIQVQAKSGVIGVPFVILKFQFFRGEGHAIWGNQNAIDFDQLFGVGG